MMSPRRKPSIAVSAAQERGYGRGAEHLLSSRDHERNSSGERFIPPRKEKCLVGRQWRSTRRGAAQSPREIGDGRQPQKRVNELDGGGGAGNHEHGVG